MFLLLLRQLPQCGDQTLASVPPPAKGRSSSSNTSLFPHSSFILPSFVWFYTFLSTGQVLLSTLSWCSACTSVSEVYSWCIHGERCTPSPPTPLPSCSLQERNNRILNSKCSNVSIKCKLNGKRKCCILTYNKRLLVAWKTPKPLWGIFSYQTSQGECFHGKSKIRKVLYLLQSPYKDWTFTPPTNPWWLIRVWHNCNILLHYQEKARTECTKKVQMNRKC